MNKTLFRTLALAVAATIITTGSAFAGKYHKHTNKKLNKIAQLGPRPFYLVDDMDEGPLKDELQECTERPIFMRSDFSIGHRGAALQFPEHTRESYMAAARMGAGIIECDVTFTLDRELVCRHSQCDLHTTTNILAIPELASKCSETFSPAEIDPDTGELLKPASARCCTSDITLAEFKTLTGKMDASNPRATTVEDYMNATPSFRTDLYTAKGTLVTHKESIELFKELGVKMTPELKSPSVPMPYQGSFSQEDYARKMIAEYKEAEIRPRNVFPQSFNYSDVLFWINEEPSFGQQAVFLDGRYSIDGFDHTDPATWSLTMEEMVEDGVNIIAPPTYMLLALNSDGAVIPSIYAEKAKHAGLDIITWTLERSGLLETGGGWYYTGINDAINNDGDTLTVLDVLAQDVGIIGIFSDWPATVTFYANCKNLR